MHESFRALADSPPTTAPAGAIFIFDLVFFIDILFIQFSLKNSATDL
jgi:hypothetical protein